VDDVGIGVPFLGKMGIFLFSIALRPALWLTQLPLRWVRGIVSPGVKRQEREDGH
jgi:hypothetical protein